MSNKKIDIPDIAQSIRDDWVPKTLHNNQGLTKLIQDHNIEILYSDSQNYDGCVRVKNGKIQMIMTKFPHHEYQIEFYNYTLAHLLGYLVLNCKWLAKTLNKHPLDDDVYFTFNAYFGSKLTANDYKSLFGHKLKNREIKWYHDTEVQAQIFALSFLMPEVSFKPLFDAKLDDFQLAQEFNVDPDIIKKRIDLSEVIEEKKAGIKNA